MEKFPLVYKMYISLYIEGEGKESNMKKFTLEICADSFESAKAAWEGGADRIELCQNLIIGGTTPSPYLFRQIHEKNPIRIHVLIRPRFGDFLYSEEEIQVMEEEIKMYREMGAEGVVIGALTPEGRLDKAQLSRLMKAADGMSVTLHRAFDMCRDPREGLQDAIDLGFHRILTSGQKNSALEGWEVLSELRKESAGKIRIMAGAGVSPRNIPQIYEKTGIMEYHMSGKITVESGMKYRKEGVSMGLPSFSEYQLFRTDKGQVEKAAACLRSLEEA